MTVDNDAGQSLAQLDDVEVAGGIGKMHRAATERRRRDLTRGSRHDPHHIWHNFGWRCKEYGRETTRIFFFLVGGNGVDEGSVAGDGEQMTRGIGADGCARPVGNFDGMVGPTSCSFFALTCASCCINFSLIASNPAKNFSSKVLRHSSYVLVVEGLESNSMAS